MNRFSPDDCKAELEVYKAAISLPSSPNLTVIQNILDAFCNENFKTWGPLELLETRTMIHAYGVFLTQEENRLKSYLGWCESNIEVLIGKELGNCAEYGYNAKMAFIKAHNEQVGELDAARMLGQIKLQTITNLSMKVHSLAESLKDLAYMKDKLSRNI